MSTQTLYYKHQDSVAVDEVGNFVTDTVGNIVSPIPPIVISPYAGFTVNGTQEKSCWHGTIAYDGFTYDWSGCTDNTDDNPVRIETDGFLLRFVHSGATGFAAVTNLRNLSKNYSTLTVKVYAGNNHDPKIYKGKETEEGTEYYTMYNATGHGVLVNWGEQVIFATTYHCPGGDYLVGSVTIDFTELSVTIDTDGVGGDTSEFPCGETWFEPKDPDEKYITVYAPNAWCSPNRTVYTETSKITVGCRVWGKNQNTIKVPNDLDEESAKDAAALAFVYSVEHHDYMISDDGTVFWEDTTYEPESVTEIEVWKLYDGVTDKSLWAENSNGATGRVWETASPNQLVALPDQRKYAARGTHVANNIEASDYPYIIGTPHKTSPWGIYTSYTVESPEYLTCQHYPNGPDNAPATVKCERQFVNLTRGDYTLRCCFNASAWVGLFEGIYGSFDMYVISVGVVHLNANGECAANPENKMSQDDAIEYTGGQIGEVRGVTNATKPGTLQTISAYGIGDGIYRRTGERGYVYEFVRKWVISPCHTGEVTAVYTGSEAGKYYLSESDATSKSNALDIAERGNNVYSFTAGEITYFRASAPIDDENTEMDMEEFE
ncbi:MAG: hypothetical protein E7047_03830 [Lentisphaerae bacterium]|nr:hypothetical protein [Lentisphaerota bacterium]